jgi:hypothetical protein
MNQAINKSTIGSFTNQRGNEKLDSKYQDSLNSYIDSNYHYLPLSGFATFIYYFILVIYILSFIFDTLLINLLYNYTTRNK